MAPSARITRNPNCPPPLLIDGCLLASSDERLLVHLYTTIPTLPSSVMSENDGPTSVASVDFEIQVSIIMDLETSSRFAKRLAEVVQSVEAHE